MYGRPRPNVHLHLRAIWKSLIEVRAQDREDASLVPADEERAQAGQKRRFRPGRARGVWVKGLAVVQLEGLEGGTPTECANDVEETVARR